MGHANPHNSPEPIWIQRASFSAPLRSCPRPSAYSVEAAWRRSRRSGSAKARPPVRLRRKGGPLPYSRGRRRTEQLFTVGEHGPEVETRARPQAPTKLSSGRRDREAHRRPPSGLALDPDLTAMSLDDPLADEEAKPGALA